MILQVAWRVGMIGLQAGQGKAFAELCQHAEATLSPKLANAHAERYDALDQARL